MIFFGLALLIGGVAVLYRYRVEIVDLLVRPVVPAWSRRLLRRAWARARPAAARLGPYLEPLRPWHERLLRLQRRLASLRVLPRRLASLRMLPRRLASLRMLPRRLASLRTLPRIGSWLRRPPWPWRSPAGRRGGAPAPRVPVPGRVRRPLVGGRGATTGRRAVGRGSGRRVYTPPRPDRGADGTLVRWVPGRAAVPPPAGAVAPPSAPSRSAAPQSAPPRSAAPQSPPPSTSGRSVGRAVPPGPRHRRDED